MPTPDEIRAFATRHNIIEEQAREILAEHGDDESRLEEAVQSLVHFLRAPS